MPGMREVLIGGVALLSVGCDESPVGPDAGPASPPDVTAYVVGAALQSLDGDGRFRFPRPSPPGAYPLLSQAQAVEIAKGVIRTWYANPDVITLIGEGLAESAERQHGGPIDWAAAEAAPSVTYYAVSHLQPLPLDAGWPAIRFYGPKFLVPFFVGPTPVAVVSVSAYATNTSVGADGRIVRTGVPTGGEFRVAGVPAALEGGTLPPSPEVAVAFAARETGLRIAELPTLGTPGNYVLSMGSLWRLELEAPADLVRRFDGRRVSTAIVYVGLWPSIADGRVGLQHDGARLRMFVAADEQPEAQSVEGMDAPLSPGYAVDLHEVRR